jgi:hypothetical protein
VWVCVPLYFRACRKSVCCVCELAVRTRVLCVRVCGACELATHVTQMTNLLICSTFLSAYRIEVLLAI